MYYIFILKQSKRIYSVIVKGSKSARILSESFKSSLNLHAVNPVTIVNVHKVSHINAYFTT